MPEDRKAFGVLQPTHQRKLALTGGKLQLNSPSQQRLSLKDGIMQLNSPSVSKKRKNDENDTPAQTVRKDGIYEDSAATPHSKRYKLCKGNGTTAAVVIDIGVQTDPPTDACTSVNVKQEEDKEEAQSVIDLLTSDEPTEKYWEMLAVERKVALSSALHENKKLHEENTELQHQVHKLKLDNSQLEEWLAEAKKLAELVESVVGNDDDDDDTVRSEQEESEHKSATEDHADDSSSNDIKIKTEDTSSSEEAQSSPKIS